MLKKIPPGEEFEIWEPHITIVPWFPVDNEVRLDDVLSAIAKQHKKLTVKAGKIEEWGRKEKYPVQKIDSDWRLLSLHWNVLRSLEKSGFPIHQKDYLGDKYTPHIALRNSLQKGRDRPRGKEIEIDRFTLIKQRRLKGSGRMIKTLVKDYELAG
jgi:hypothetical protein